MLNYNFIDITDKEDVHKIAHDNMKVADQNHNLKFMIASSMGWFKINPNKDFKDLEDYLRKHNFMTHIIAKKQTINGTLLKPNNKEIKCNYEGIYSFGL